LLLSLFSGISAADRPSLMVNEQHLRLCFRSSHAKETFQHQNHELHRGLVVIQKQYVATLEVRHCATSTRPACMVRSQALLLKALAQCARTGSAAILVRIMQCAQVRRWLYCSPCCFSQWLRMLKPV